MKKAQLILWLMAVTPFLQSGGLRPTPGQRPGTPDRQHAKVLIAAAADLRYAMDSLVAAFTRLHPGADIQVVYGSSGNFYEQIRNGAPFDIFFSADMDYPEKLKADGKVPGPVNAYGVGSLVLWSKSIDPALQGMHTLENNAISKIAIANPAHAPYGKRAVESLQFYKLYDKVKDKLVLGENISQAAQFAATGSADIGMIALSLALSPAFIQAGGKYWIIPPESHARQDQGFVLTPHADGNTDARAFYQFVGTPVAVSILNRFGFGSPTTHS